MGTTEKTLFLMLTVNMNQTPEQLQQCYVQMLNGEETLKSMWKSRDRLKPRWPRAPDYACLLWLFLHSIQAIYRLQLTKLIRANLNSLYLDFRN